MKHLKSAWLHVRLIKAEEKLQDAEHYYDTWVYGWRAVPPSKKRKADQHLAKLERKVEKIKAKLTKAGA